jgi:hypothetical protein
MFPPPKSHTVELGIAFRARTSFLLIYFPGLWTGDRAAAPRDSQKDPRCCHLYFLIYTLPCLQNDMLSPQTCLDGVLTLRVREWRSSCIRKTIEAGSILGMSSWE